MDVVEIANQMILDHYKQNNDASSFEEVLAAMNDEKQNCEIVFDLVGAAVIHRFADAFVKFRMRQFDEAEAKIAARMIVLNGRSFEAVSANFRQFIFWDDYFPKVMHDLMMMIFNAERNMKSTIPVDLEEIFQHDIDMTERVLISWDGTGVEEDEHYQKAFEYLNDPTLSILEKHDPIVMMTGIVVNHYGLHMDLADIQEFQMNKERFMDFIKTRMVNGVQEEFTPNAIAFLDSLGDKLLDDNK